MGNINQIWATMVLCFLCFNMGVMYTWPSSTLTIFSSANTTLHRTMTEGEIALLGSLSSVGAMVSTPIAGVLLDRIGRKRCSIGANLLAVVGWAMIAFSKRVEVVLTSIFVSGFSGAAFIINTVYIAEICHESMRGTMSSGIMVFYGIGMLVQYVLGGYLNYWTAVYTNMTMSILGVTFNCLLKESPLYLLSRGFEKEAAAALGFFRQSKPDSKLVQDEMEKIRRVLNPVIDEDENCEETKLQADQEKKVEKLSTIQFLRKSRSTHRAIIVTLTLMTACIFQGLPVVQVYADPLFTEAVPVMSSTISSIILAVITVIAGLVAAVLTDAAGRKPLMIYGSLGSGICALLLGTQIHLSWGPNWLTAVIIYMFCVVYTFGAGTVPFVLAAEVFVPEVKSFIAMLVVEWAWLCNFLILLIFNPLVSAIGLGPVFYIFSAVCFLTAVYSVFYLPETKGLTVDAIQLLFAPKKKKQYV
ncbi:facilitated trehalose transporter Tret1-like [Ostrinia nubilalis]|uniref:facilitated trehalose transporter Tret1-like n=1 Tax=Ostrinia nubilalis TaxID=29057 RepID=UPI0030824AD9